MLSLPHLHSRTAQCLALAGIVIAGACSGGTASDATSSESSSGESTAGEGEASASESESETESESESATGEPAGYEIVAGTSVGPITLESTFGQAVAELGEPDLVFVTDAVGFARYEEFGLELVFSSPEASMATDDSVIFALGVKRVAGFFGELTVGQSRDEVLAAWGEPLDTVDSIEYFGEGISAMFDADGRVEEVGIFAPYQNAAEPPEMSPASAPSAKDDPR